ncbi:reverse transcriptase domain-containing protein [Tanacetum coccineum]
MKHSYLNDDTCFSIDVIDEILEEDLNVLLDEGSKILHSIEGTLLEEEIFTEFDEFMAMTADENYLNLIPKNRHLRKSPSIQIIKSKHPLKNLLRILNSNPFLIIWNMYSWKNPLFFLRLNPNMKEVVKKEIVKLLDTGIIYPIADSPWVSPIHCIPKKGGITVVTNENDELVPTRTVTGWRVCIDYRKLNESTIKDHFPLSFMDQMLERLTGNKYFCFLDGFSRYFQIPIDHSYQEKTTFTCPFGTYAYRRMPFGLCNAPATFQRCMLAIFHDMIEESVKRCKDAHLVLNWEKYHFMVKEGIVL